MHRAVLLFLLLLLTRYSYGQNQEQWQENYPNHVGEIAFDEKNDEADFKVADTLALFTKPRIEGEKPAIVKYFKERYQSRGFEKVNRYVTIRFYVSKAGKAGKFRMQAMNFDYQATACDEQCCEQILQLTKQFRGWKPIEHEGKAYGYYCYLSFKIVNGTLKELMP